MGWSLPKAKLVMPTSLYGATNGNLPSSLLTKIGVGSAVMERTAARSFIAMFAEARKVGFDIRHVGDYRSFQQQLNLFTSRYMPTGVAEYGLTPPSRRKKWDDAQKFGFDSNYWVKKKIGSSYPATAATPGASNHGWGLALDIAEEYDSDSAPDPIRTAFVNWLVGNAHRFGISAELDSEPWHWRYVAGDNIPQATLQFENGSGLTVVPPPPPSPEGPALAFKYPGQPLKLGSKGAAVKLVQGVVGAKPDGDFGAATHRRVKDWQFRNGLLDDGVVGAVTWKKMFG